MTEASRSLDPYNDYQVDCQPQGISQSYKLCLHILSAIDFGVIGDRFPECQGCASDGTCKAKSMREEEVQRGESLYFVESPLKAKHENHDEGKERVVVSSERTNTASASYQRGYEKPGAPPKIQTKPKPKPSPVQADERGKGKTRQRVAPLKPANGESMASFINRLRESSNGNTQE